MAKVPLRSYINEIETIIEQKQTEEAIAHCRHILQMYPKNIDTYRMLGKAYLESQRYSNAADIFQRVLSAIPDDFVSHVGMSIIREDESDLDAAIWHMERAFEGQPYNAAIQGELRRLFGLRDGMEPPKVHLTRGALARMYVKGSLHQQAIAELRSAIAEDPKRFDLQVSLAQMYTQSGQNAKAIDTCGTIINKLPYCLDANLNLARLLETTERSEEAEAYKKRVEELNPYQAFVGPNAPTEDRVPAQAVLIEQLIWDGGPAVSTPDQPEWATSVGVTLEDSRSVDEDLPDWMSDAPDGVSMLPASLEGDPEAEEDEIPEFMKEAGWGPSTGAFDESQSVFEPDDEDSPLETAEAVAGDMPDWLQQMAPPEEEEPAVGADKALDQALPSEDGDSLDWLQEVDTERSDEESDVPDWLAPAAVGVASMMGSSKTEDETAEAGETQTEDGVPDWLQEAIDDEIEQPKPATETELTATEETQIPDWLQDIDEGEEIAPEPEAKLPDWLQDSAEEDGATSATAIESLETERSGVTDWLQELGGGKDTSLEPISEEAELPDWLQEGVAEETSEAVVETVETEVADLADEAEEAELPDWLQEDLAEEVSEAVTETVESEVADLADEAEEAELPDWLQEDVAAETSEAVAEDVETEATELVEEAEEAELPDWLQEDVAEETSEAVAETVEAEVADFADEVEDGQIPDWLAPAAGAVAAASLLSSDDKEAKPVAETEETELPDWLQEDVAAETSEAVAEDVETEDAELVEEAEEAELPDWLQEDVVEGVSEAVAEDVETKVAELVEEAEEAELPDWLQEGVAEETSEAVAEAVETEVADLADEAEEAELPDWLQEDVAAETSEAVAETVEAEVADLADEAEEAELPDWLQEDVVEGVSEAVAEDVETEAAELVEEAEEAELPDWLQEDVAAETSGAVAETIETEVADLADEAEEAELTDWLQEDVADEMTESIAEAVETEVADLADEAEEAELPDWLQEDIAEETTEAVAETVETEVADLADEAEEAELPDWLQEDVAAETSEAVAETIEAEVADLADEAEDGQIPDWIAPAAGAVAAASLLSSDDEEAEPAAETEETELPDWLQEDVAAETSEAVAETVEAEIVDLVEEVEETALPDWLQEAVDDEQTKSDEEFEAVDLEGAEIPDWLQEALDEEAPEPTAEAEALEAEIPDWIQDSDKDEPSEAVEEGETDSLADSVKAVSAAGAMAAGIAAIVSDDAETQGAESTEIPVAEDEPVMSEESTETLLDDVQEIADDQPDSTELEMDDAAEQTDSSVLELEKTVEEISIKDETDFVDDEIPEITTDDLPDWLQEIPEETSTVHPEVEAAESKEEIIPEWLQDISDEVPTIAGESEIELESPIEPEIEDIPEWLQDIAEEQVPGEVEESESEKPEVPDFEDADAAMAWMESLAAKQGVSEDELLTKPDERSETPPDWVQEIVSTEAESSSIIETASDEKIIEDDEINELPDWLSEPIEVDEIEEAVVEEDQTAVEIQVEQPSDLELSEDLQETISAEIEETEVSESVLDSEVIVEMEETATGEDIVAPEFDDVDAAMAWLENLAAKQGVSEDELLTSPEERIETPPDWVQDVVDSDEAQSELEESATLEDFPAEEGEIPEWILEDPETEEPVVELEIPSVEMSEIPEIVEVSTSDIDTALTEVDEAIPDFEDADAAMAWLESLAAKQGVSEDELLTKPEERSETPPDWVQDSIEMEDVTPIEATSASDEVSIEEEDLSDWLAKVPDPTELEELPTDTEGVVADSGTPEPLDDSTEVELDFEDADAAMAWLESLAAKQGVAEEELLTSPEERRDTPPNWVQDAIETDVVAREITSSKDVDVEETPSTDEPIPALFPEDPVKSQRVEEEATLTPPAWISDGDIPEDEDLSWLQTAVSEEEDQLLDLNQASLIQLERLPGIGFRRAQSITAYRDEHGSFKGFEDLRYVPGMDSDTLELLKARVYIHAPETEPEPEEEFTLFETQEADDAVHEQQLAAQSKLNQGDISEAMSDYGELIKKNQRLDAIIVDLNFAAEKFPEDITIVQTLGDAYMQANQLEEALEAYTKAEELLK